MVALLGASGSGKSTLLRCVCGLEKLDANGGCVHLQGRTLQSDAPGCAADSFEANS